MSLQAALEDAQAWLEELRENGPDLTAKAHLKTAHEAAEFAEDPSLAEAADVLICLAGAALHHGWALDDVAQAVYFKTAINSARQWYQKPDGTWQHK